MTMASAADLNVAMGQIMKQVNLQGTEASNVQMKITALERNFADGGKEILERMEAKKVEMVTLQQQSQLDLLTFAPAPPAT